MENKKDKSIEHLFESNSLTFGDLKYIYSAALKCEYFTNSPILEKTDGQNLLFTYNKSELIFGKGNATKQITMYDSVLYSDKKHINDSFLQIYKILKREFSKIKNPDYYFDNGKVWINCEILNPETKNVIYYGSDIYIQFHCFVTFVDGKRVEYGVGLHNLVEEFDSKYIICDNVLQFKNQSSYECIKAVGLLESKLRQLYKQYGLSDTSLIRDYYKNAFKLYIHKNITTEPEYVVHLMNRWGGYERKYRLDRKSISNDSVLNTAKEYDSDAWLHSQKLKDSLKDIFLFLGTLIMQNFENIICPDIVNSIQDLHTEHFNYCNEIETYLRRCPTDHTNRTLYYKYTKIINNIGFDKYIPIEGIVFEYKNNQYKITNGLFTILNQLHGIVKYGNLN